MSIAWQAEAALREGRTAAESLMVDTCRVERPGALVTDPVTGEVTTSYTTIHSGPCKVQSTQPQAQAPTAGEHKWTVQPSAVHLPVSAPAVAVDDRVVITASVHDSQLVGRVFLVTELLHKSWATARRVNVEEVTA